MKPLVRIVAPCVLWACAACAQMLDPALDRPNEPFSYFSRPTDVIGVMDARAATEITPEGYLYTGYGELMFFAGNPPRPVNQRVKSLLRSYLPVVQYEFTREGLRYAITAFAASLDGKPEGTIVNFVRVSIRNDSQQRATAYFAAATRYQPESNLPGGNGDNRFFRPTTPKYPGAYSQPGVEFNPKWTYGFADDVFVRDGKVLYLFPPAPKPALSPTLKTSYNYPPDLKTRALNVLPTTPLGVAQYRFVLDPGAEKTLVFKMPLEPLSADSPALAQVRAASFDEYLKRTAGFWEGILARGIDVAVPETKVNDTFKANLIYDLIARDKVGADYVQTVNKFHYHAFWLRDASYIVRMYDLSGYHDIARQCLDFFPRWQQPDGNFVSQGGQFDGWGQTLWAYGEHYRITNDHAFAEGVYPSVQKAVAWLHQAREGDPLHLMPATTPGDNEDITGHVTGHNFWALAGLKNAIALAEGLGRTDDIKAWRREYDDFRNTLLGVLAKVTASTAGYIPPGLDGQHGQDWGNLLAVYPEIILPADDPMVTATLNGTRAKYQEGIMTYGDGAFLHHYLTMKNTETEVIRGDQQMAVEELYALLVHTSSTHAGFEYSIHPWGTRDFDGNMAPHGWFAAKFRALLRNMLVREQGDDLHLLSVVSPAWVQDGREIVIERAAANFGVVNLRAQFAAGRATIRLNNQFRQEPKRIVLHLPWFMRATRISADGKAVPLSGASVVLPASTKEVVAEWTRAADTPALSYDSAVRAWLAEYRQRYERWKSDSE